MSTDPNDWPDFQDFVHGSDVYSMWNAARRLMAAKRMQSAASKGEFRASFRNLGSIASESAGVEQLLAIALIVRISELVKGELKREAAHILSQALQKPLDGPWTISESRKLPFESKLSEIRENIALALTHASGPWIIPYVVEAIAREEKSFKCRLDLVRQLARRNSRVSDWLEMFNEFRWLDILESQTFDRAKNLRELAAAIATVVRESRNNLVVDEKTGPALATLVQKILPVSSRTPRNKKMSDAALAVSELVDQFLSTEFTLIADPEAYSPIAVISRWWQLSSYPQSLEEGLATIIRKLIGAIRLRARLGQKSETLSLRLRQAFGSGGSSKEALLNIAQTEVGLAPEIDDWLRGRERESSPTAIAISSLLSESGSPIITEMAAALLLDCLDADATMTYSPDQPFSGHLNRICGRIQAMAAELKLKTAGIVGEIVEFNPNAHRTVTGNLPSDPLVKLRRPMVIRQRDDGSHDIIERALVEEP